MSTTTQTAAQIAGTLLMVVGAVGFLGGALFGSGVDLGISDLFELPLGDLRGIAVDSEGNVYCGLQFYSRVQVYDAAGRYLHGIFIGNPGAFRIRIDGDDQLEVATARRDRLYTFARGGTPVRVLSDVGHYFNDFGEAGETQCYSEAHGVTYFIKRSLLFPSVVMRNSRGEERVVITTPFYKWPFMGPFPACLVCAAGAGIRAIVKGGARRRRFLTSKNESTHN